MLGRSGKIRGWMFLGKTPCPSSISNVPLEWECPLGSPKSSEIWKVKGKSWLEIPLLTIPPVSLPGSCSIFPVPSQDSWFVVSFPSFQSIFPVPSQYSQSFSSLEYLQPQPGSPKGIIMCQEMLWICLEFRGQRFLWKVPEPLEKQDFPWILAPAMPVAPIPFGLFPAGAGSGFFPFSLLVPTPGFDLFPPGFAQKQEKPGAPAPIFPRPGEDWKLQTKSFFTKFVDF